MSSRSPRNCCCGHTICDVSLLGNLSLLKTEIFLKPLLLFHKAQVYLPRQTEHQELCEKGQLRSKRLCEKTYCFQITTVTNSKSKKEKYKSMSELTSMLFFVNELINKGLCELFDKITKSGHFYAKFKCIFF